LEAGRQRHVEALAEHDEVLANLRAAADLAQQATATFQTRVATEGLEGLEVAEVAEVLHLLGTPVPRAVLEAEEICGVVLAELTEPDMQSVLAIETLGGRRRFAHALKVRSHGRRIAHAAGL
jgi:repressor of nif and glnA expression